MRIEHGVPVPKVPANKGVLKSHGVKIPWDSMTVGSSFFLINVTQKDRNAIYMAASRRKFKAQTELRVGGLKVWRVG